MNENMRKIVERLEKHASPTPSKWREVSKVLKGRENLSLETLAKIENALGISIIKEEPLAV